MQERTIDREAVLSLWEAGAPPQHIAVEVGCHASSIYRIAQEAFFNGDPRGAPQTEEARDLFRAKLHMEKIATQYRKGVEIEQISKSVGLAPHLVRAAVYLATAAGLDTGLTLGERA